MSLRALLILPLLLLPAVLSAAPSLASQPDGGSPQSTVHRVSIKGMVFVPAQLEVKAGDTIEWVNDDFVPHTVTAAPTDAGPKAFDSGVLLPKQTFRYTVPKAGSHPYVCTLHPTMSATFSAK